MSKRKKHEYLSKDIQALYNKNLKRLNNLNPNTKYYTKFMKDLNSLLLTDASTYTNAIESIFFEKFSNIYKDFESNAIVNTKYTHTLENLRSKVYDIFVKEYSKATRKVQNIIKKNKRKKGYILYHLNKANEIAFGLVSKEVHTALDSLLSDVLNANLNEELETISVKEGVLNCVVHFLDTKKFNVV